MRRTARLQIDKFQNVPLVPVSMARTTGRSRRLHFCAISDFCRRLRREQVCGVYRRNTNHAHARRQYLGFKVDGSPETSVHVHRHGLVAVGDFPHVAGLAQAQGVAKPNIGLRTAGAASGQVDQRMAKCDVIASDDVQVSDLVADLAASRGKPALQSLGMSANGLQWRCEIELNEVPRLMCDHSAASLALMACAQESTINRISVSADLVRVWFAMTLFLVRQWTLVISRDGVMLVCDTPRAIDLPQTDRQSEQKPALLRRAAECGGAAAHDGNSEGDIFAGGDFKLLDVECLQGFVIFEKQVPGFPVFIHSPRSQRRRNVEHHDVL